MEGLIPKFEACGLYDFMGQKTDFNEMVVKQFLATAEIDIDEQSITWMTGFKRYSATFAEFATVNSLDYGTISVGIDLYTEDNFEEFVQFYEPARLGIPRRFGETAGLRHHPAVINKIARVTILPKSGDKRKIRDKFWNIIHHIMNGEVMNVVLFMMRQLNDLKMDKNQNLAYAPYIMALIKAKTRFEGHYEITHTPFRPFKNEIGFLTRPLTPFPDDEEEAGEDEGVAPEPDAAEQMPPPPPPPQPQQFWQPDSGYFDPYFQQMQQGLQAHMDGRFQGMMTHMDQCMDAMQTRFDDNLDALNSELSEFRSHIQDTIHDPLMTRMNNMHRAFRIIWGPCPVSLTTCPPMKASRISVRGNNSSRMTSGSSPLSSTLSAPITTTCTLHLVISETPPLWQLMPKGERREEKLGIYVIFRGSSCGH
jgi:hypothetical protein